MRARAWQSHLLDFPHILKVRSLLPAVEIQQPKTTTTPTKRRRNSSTKARGVVPAPWLAPAPLTEGDECDQRRRSPCPSVTDSEYSASSSGTSGSSDHLFCQPETQPEPHFRHVFEDEDVAVAVTRESGHMDVFGTSHVAEHLLDDELAAWIDLLS